MRGNRSYVCHNRKGVRCLYCSGGDSFLFGGIGVPLSCFCGVLGSCFRTNRVRICRGGLLSNVSGIGVAPCVRRVFTRLRSFARCHNKLKCLFLRDGIFRLLSMCLDRILRLDVLTSACITVSEDSQSSVVRTGRVVSDRLTLTPDYRRLTQRIGVDASGLAGNFSSLFKASIRTCIVSRQLRGTTDLLLRDGLGIDRITVLIKCSGTDGFTTTFGEGCKIGPGGCGTRTAVKWVRGC